MQGERLDGDKGVAKPDGDVPRRPIARAFALVAVVAVAGLLIGFVRFVADIDMTERAPVRHADGIVALTGGSERVSDAIALLSQGHADRLLITGVNLATSKDDLVRHVPGARPWVECCVDLGYRAANTVGNARETAEWVRAHGLRSLIVVTSNYHMPRALAEMAFRLPAIDLEAYPVVSDRTRAEPWWTSPQLTRLLLAEYVKFLAVKTRQAILPSDSSADGYRVARDAT